jgi:hypothetical protein
MNRSAFALLQSRAGGGANVLFPLAPVLRQPVPIGFALLRPMPNAAPCFAQRSQGLGAAVGRQPRRPTRDRALRVVTLS